MDIHQKAIEDLLFADDMALLSQKVSHSREKTSSLAEEGGKVGLKINVPKTKEMRVRYGQNALTNSIGEEEIEQVNTFQYLGSIYAFCQQMGLLMKTSKQEYQSQTKRLPC